MQVNALPFRLDSDTLDVQLVQFNARQEIRWFGLQGLFQPPGEAMVYFKMRDQEYSAVAEPVP